MSQGGVSSPGVVEALDVLEDRTSRYVPSRPRVVVDQLPLERGNEALGHRVVVGIGHRSPRGQKALFPEPAPELHRGVLAAPIGVVNQPSRWPASVDGLAFTASRTNSVLRLFAMDHRTTLLE